MAIIAAKNPGTLAALHRALATTNTSITIEADTSTIYAHIPDDALPAWYEALGGIWADRDLPRPTVAGAYSLLNQIGDALVNNHINRTRA